MFRSNLLILGGAALLVAGCAPSLWTRSPQSLGTEECPLQSQGETEEDCPWAGWVREAQRDPARTQTLPEPIRVSLERDRADPAILEAWGLSQNYDEGVRAEIVSLPTLEVLARGLGVAPLARGERTVIHAGLIHTYGYLLSNLRTSFGYKRSRWVSGRIERGLGLPLGTLSPQVYALAPDTSLLAQVTYLLMKVALRDQPAQWAEWETRLGARITPPLRELSVSGAARSTEIQVRPSGERLEWITDFLPLPQDPKGGRLLVYSQRSREGVRVITGFPVEKDFSERKNTPVKPRYNAWVD
jgi:hypothetical protein